MNIVNTYILSKAINRLKVAPVKTLTMFFTEIEKKMVSYGNTKEPECSNRYWPQKKKIN